MSEILERPVLVLDKTYYPSHVTTVRDIIVSLCLGKVKVLSTDWTHYSFDDWVKKGSSEIYIKSPNLIIPLPKVVRSSEWINKDREKQKSKYSRMAVFKRDNWKCQYCGKFGHKKNLTIDHIIPRSKDGKNTFENTVACCKKCNSIKGSKSLEELFKDSGGKLIRKPVSPSLVSFIRNSYPEEYEQYWKHFI